ncbi:exosortase [Sphingomonas guangdongensis]|uniref:Exosortase n=1 Tax=Sphingomonas guangdongensis TaxID=1141890 RepID=A0A285QLV9_9SPHN|nr:exosortase V [Sphingomonas guangdongensis]SOB81082.1 exosortase [Sphingomonas guangdongensis]
MATRAGAMALDQRWLGLIRNGWFLALAAAAFAGPPLAALARVVWSTEQGAQGPIILMTGLWLLTIEAIPVLRSGIPQPGRRGLVAAWLVASLLPYAIASMLGVVWLQWAATYSALVAVGYAYAGGQVLKRLWFPLFYLLFLIPPPYSVMLALTRALKLWISSAAVEILTLFGYNVASSGTTLFIDQYELLVAAACAGMNSLFSLLAIGLFYIYLRHRSEWRYAVVLAALVIPIAIAANLLRVILLLLITKYLGNQVAQGILHDAAGLSMFMLALLLLIAIDAALDPLRRRLGRTALTA